MQTSASLRVLAAWYRDFAERAENPVIWEARLQTAQDLDREADRLELCGTSMTPIPAEIV